MSILRSIGAIIVGILSGAIPTIACDKFLELNGFMNAENFAATPLGIIYAVIAYRAVFNILGCYVCARLAPKAPMVHCLIIGALGLVGSLAATISMPEAGPQWYGFSVAAISLPCAWIGAQIRLRKVNAGQTLAS